MVIVESSQNIGFNASLLDKGLDSLGTTELSDALQSCFEVKLPSTFLFNNPTIADMANHIFGLLEQSVEGNKGDKTHIKQGSKMKNTLSKVWSMEEIQSEVEAAVRKVISIESSQQIDHDISLMDEGLDSLGTTELSDALQSQLGVELPSTFVFNNPTIADMSHHLHRLLSPEMDIVNKRKLIDTKAGDYLPMMQ